MHIVRKSLIPALLLTALFACSALAAEEILLKTLEDSYAVETGSDTLQVNIEQWHYAYRKHDLRFFIAHVMIADPAQMQTAFAGEKYTRDAAEATSAIAARHDAVIAINGDYYNFKESRGVVIRNGVLYRDEAASRDLLLVMKDGSFRTLPRRTHQQGTAQALLDEGVMQCFTFGPTLVENGAAAELPEKYAIATRDTQREPRTAIGQVDNTHYVLIVADGRRNGWSEKGMTLQELQQAFLEQGCAIAYNLDGGGSATLVAGGERINRSSGSRERDVSDIIYFTK